MKVFAFYKLDTGEVTQILANKNREPLSDRATYLGLGLIEIDPEIVNQVRQNSFRVQDGQLIIAPANLDKNKAARELLIVAEKNRRTMQPVAYDGASFDPAVASPTTVVNKINALSLRTAGGLFTFRDGSNVRTFSNIATYRAWLEGLALALDDRDEQINAWYWVKMDALKAATTIAQIEAIDATA